jgi:hypothetical protein
MPIETNCPGCGRRLRVSDEHLGRQARCPMCNAIYQVEATPPTPGTTADEPQWRMRTPEGQTFGPVAKRDIDQWVAEGRVTAECRLRQDDWASWRTADAVYPSLRAQPATASPVAAHSDPRSGPSPFARATRTPRARPHRAALILAFGVLSWMVCPLFGILAWTMGSADLRAMRAGLMDPAGIPLTQAGQILGMVHVLIALAIFGMVAFFGLIAGVANM